jgi:hypothetical protein
MMQNSLTGLEKEAEQIIKLFQSILNTDRGLIESRVRLWRTLGDALIVHRANVWAAGEKWQSWAAERFKNLKHTRREQAIALAEYGSSLEVFYFLGIDLLYPFANLMLEFVGDPEIVSVAEYFNLRVGANIIHVDQCKYRINIEKLYEYFKFKKEMGSISYNKDLVLSVISADVTFDSHDYGSIKELSPDPAAQFDYLFEMLVNGCSPKSASASTSNQESIIVLIAKFIQLADKHFACDTYPPCVTKNEFKPFLSRAERYFENLSQ